MAMFILPLQVEALHDKIRLLKFIISCFKIEDIDLTKINEKLFSDSISERNLAVEALDFLGVKK